MAIVIQVKQDREQRGTQDWCGRLYLHRSAGSLKLVQERSRYQTVGWGVTWRLD